MRFLLVVLLMFSPPVIGAQFTVMHGSSSTLLDDAQATMAYATAHGIDSSTAPEEYAGLVLNAEKIVATVNDLGSDPTNPQKLVALNAMSSLKDCREYRDDQEADVSAAPTCFLAWEDTTVGVNDCQTLLVCATPGAQLCNAVAGQHTLVKRNPQGTRCTSACQQPEIRLRVLCQ